MVLPLCPYPIALKLNWNIKFFCNLFLYIKEYAKMGIKIKFRYKAFKEMLYNKLSNHH